MAKYQDVRDNIVEAEVYREGMEDGFIHYTIGSSVETGQFYSRDSPYFPKNCRQPALKGEDGTTYLIGRGDYIVTLADGSRKVEDEKIFNEKYLLLADTIEKV